MPVKLAALLLAAVAVAFHAYAREDDPELKRDAVSRVVESHDPTLSIGIGRVYVKQAALLAARDLLAERGRAAGMDRSQWHAQSEPWRSAERELLAGIDDLIVDKVVQGAWVQEAWSELIDRTFNAEEADEIAMHFQSEGGKLQRKVIEWFVGELTLQTYTFTDRLKYGVPGSEQEMRDLQLATYQRIFPGIQDFTSYPDAVRFASIDPGVKYFKMMAIQGVHAIHVHLEQVANQARATIRSRAALVDPHIARARAGAR